MVKVNLLRVLMTLTIVIGILVTFHLGAYPAQANSLQEPIVSQNNLNWNPFIWAVVIIGGSIGITLSYVSWRKYKGEQKHHKKKDKMID